MTEHTIVIKLEYPVQLPEGLLAEVSMRRPKLKDLLKHSTDKPSYGMKEEANLLADLCNMNPEDLGELDSMDFEALQQQLVRFRTKEEKPKS